MKRKNFLKLVSVGAVGVALTPLVATEEPVMTPEEALDQACRDIAEFKRQRGDVMFHNQRTLLVIPDNLTPLSEDTLIRMIETIANVRVI